MTSRDQAAVTAHWLSGGRAGRTARPAHALLALVAIALVWGVAFGVAKESLASQSPASLVTWRFLVATAALLVIRPTCLVKVSRATWARGAALGCILGAAYLVHTVGLQRSSVVSSAFITGTTVVFAPLIGRIWPGRKLAPQVVVAIALAAAGLAVITFRGSNPGVGEALLAVAAVLWAVHLVALGVWSRAGEVYAIAVIQVFVASVVAATVEIATAGRLTVPGHLSTAAALIGLGAIATGGAFLLLSWAQTRIDATTAAVVLTLEPVFGALTAIGLGETISLRLIVGALAVTAAAVLVAKPRQAPTAALPTCSRARLSVLTEGVGTRLIDARRIGRRRRAAAVIV